MVAKISIFKRLILALALMVITIVFLLITIQNKAFMRECFHRGSYFIILTLFYFWLLTLCEAWHTSREKLKPLAGTYGWGILFSTFIAALIFISSPPQYRVLADETNLIGTSQAMTCDRRTDGVLEGVWFYQTFHPDQASRCMPTRPFLFPFLVHLVSVANGYHAFNAFLANFIALVMLFFLVYVLIYQFWESARWSYTAVFLIAAQPAISLTATSAAFDLVAGLFLVVCFACLKWYLEEPSPIRLQLLWVNLLMLANVRYESIVFFVIAIFVLAFAGALKFRNFTSSYAYCLTPFFLLPLIWQRILIPRHPFGEPSGVKPFSATHLLHNSGVFFKNLFSMALHVPYANLVNVVGILSILFFCILFLRGRWATTRNERVLLAFAVLCFCAHWLITLSFFDATIELATNARKYVLPCIALSVLAIMLIRRLPLFTSQKYLGVLFSFSMFLFYQPFAIENRYTNTLSLTREYRICLDFLTEQENHDFLVVADRPGLYTVHEFGAISFKTANQKKDEVLRNLRRHLYGVFIIQEILYDGLKPTEATALDPAYKLQSVYALQNTATSFVQISKALISANDLK